MLEPNAPFLPSFCLAPRSRRGDTRVPSLTSVWSTAPFLLNNSVGPFSRYPSVEERLKVFDASIKQMLWPETRERDAELGDKVDGKIDRTDARSFLFIPNYYVQKVREHVGPIARRIIDKRLDDGGYLQIGPIPKGTPVNLLAKLILVSSRSVNSLVWALLFVGIFGPGALAGTLAIAFRSIGFVGKLFVRQCANRLRAVQVRILRDRWRLRGGR